MTLQTLFITLALAGLYSHTTLHAGAGSVAASHPLSPIATHDMPLNDRYSIPSVNTVFKENILLTLAYLRGISHQDSIINWDEVNKPFTYSLTLKPQEVFAFHDGVLPEFKDRVTLTTTADFQAHQGFKSDGYLVGDGVCHLASLMNWVASDAGLLVTARVNHNFAKIPDIPQRYGVAIYDDPNSLTATSMQNLYVQNNKNQPITFEFIYKDNSLILSALADSATQTN